MMNSILFQPAESLQDMRVTTDDMPVIDDGFATMPMLSVPSAFHHDQDEEVYTSFEEAISGRVLAMQRQLQLRRLSDSLIGFHGIETVQTTSAMHDVVLPRQPAQPSVQYTTRTSRVTAFAQAWRRPLLAGGLGLALMLIGFDLMGLLVLYLR